MKKKKKSSRDSTCRAPTRHFRWEMVLCFVFVLFSAARSEVEGSRPAALLVSQHSNTIATEFRLFLGPAASDCRVFTAVKLQ